MRTVHRKFLTPESHGNRIAGLVLNVGQARLALSLPRSNGDVPMKMLLATVALAALLVSPALSQTRSQYRAYGLWRAPPPAAYYSYAFSRRPLIQGWTVYDITGQYVGRDPDPNVRSQLAHDPTGGD